MQEAAEDKAFSLQVVDGKPHLSKEHQYHYQVQTQIFILERAHCDLVVWTKDNVHIECIVGNDAFWGDAVAAATHFFKVGILPELVGKYFTKPPQDLTNYQIETDDSTEKWCYCQKGKSGHMIQSDNATCQFKWFHLACLKLTNSYQPPKTWFCPDCRKLKNVKRKVLQKIMQTAN